MGNGDPIRIYPKPYSCESCMASRTNPFEKCTKLHVSMAPAARMTAWSSCTNQEVYRLAWPLLQGCQHGLWLKSKKLPPPPMEGRARVRVRVSSVLDVQAGVAFKVSGDEVRRVGFRCKGHGNLPSPYSL